MFYKYMCVMASHEVNPPIVSPSDFRKILQDVKDEIQ